jgi:uncharacterized protein DUF6210
MNNKLILPVMSDRGDMIPLIVLHKTGVFFTDQVGGMACCHPEAEGFVLRVSDYYKVIDDCKSGLCWIIPDQSCYGETKIEKKCRNDDIDAQNKIGAEIDIKFVMLDREEGIGFKDWHGTVINMRFDFDRVNELTEGWWPVKFDMKLNDNNWNDDNSNYGKFKGILCTGNCD